MSSVRRGCRSSPHEPTTTILLIRVATVYCVFTTFVVTVYYCFNTLRTPVSLHCVTTFYYIVLLLFTICLLLF